MYSNDTLINIQDSRYNYLLQEYFYSDINLYLNIHYKISKQYNVEWIYRKITIKIFNLFTSHITESEEIMNHKISILLSIYRNIKYTFEYIIYDVVKDTDCKKTSWNITNKKISVIISNLLTIIEKDFNQSIIKNCKP